MPGKASDAATHTGAKIGIAIRVMDLREILTYAIHDGKSLLSGGMRQTDQKLFTTVAAKNVLLAQTLLEQPRQAADDLIAHWVTVAVVNVFEMIDIEHHHR